MAEMVMVVNRGKLPLVLLSRYSLRTAESLFYVSSARVRREKKRQRNFLIFFDPFRWYTIFYIRRLPHNRKQIQ